MISKIKEKVKRFKKWIIGFLIGTAMAAPLAAMPPEDTNYRIYWRETFATQERFDRAKLFNPNVQYQIVPESQWANMGFNVADRTHIVTLSSYQFHATSTGAAKDFIFKNSEANQSLAGAYVEAQALTLNYVSKFSVTDLFKEYDRRGIAKTVQAKQKDYALGLFKKYVLGFVDSAYADYPIDNFETGYTAADLDGQSGGSGWGPGAWGIGGATAETNGCQSPIDASQTTPIAGSWDAEQTTATDGWGCARNIATTTSELDVFNVDRRLETASVQYIIVRFDSTGHATSLQIYCLGQSTGAINCYNNLTSTDTGETWTEDTTFTYKITTKYSTEQFDAQKDSQTVDTYTMYDNTTYTAVNSDKFKWGATSDNAANAIDNFTFVEGDAAPAVDTFIDDGQVIFIQ